MTEPLGRAHVFADPVASPTGFRFKVVRPPVTLSEAEDYDSRECICDLGYLRHLFRKLDGPVGYRCPAEPGDAFVLKGGSHSAADVIASLLSNGGEPHAVRSHC